MKETTKLRIAGPQKRIHPNNSPHLPTPAPIFHIVVCSFSCVAMGKLVSHDGIYMLEPRADSGALWYV